MLFPNGANATALELLSVFVVAHVANMVWFFSSESTVNDVHAVFEGEHAVLRSPYGQVPDPTRQSNIPATSIPSDPASVDF